MVLVVIVVPFNKSYTWLKILPLTLDPPNWPASPCSVASEAAVEGGASPGNSNPSWVKPFPLV